MRPEETPGPSEPRRSQETPGGLGRPQKTPGSLGDPRRPQETREAPGDPRRSQEARGDPKETRGDLGSPQEPPGDPRRTPKPQESQGSRRSHQEPPKNLHSQSLSHSHSVQYKQNSKAARPVYALYTFSAACSDLQPLEVATRRQSLQRQIQS